MYFITRNVCLFSGANHFHCCHIFYIVQWPAKCETFAGYQLLETLETWVVSINPKSQKSKSSQTEQNTAAVRSEKGSLVSQGGGAVEFSQTFWGTAICCRNFSCNLPAFRSVTSFRFPPTFLSRSVQWQWHFGRTPNAGNAPEIE